MTEQEKLQQMKTITDACCEQGYRQSMCQQGYCNDDKLYYCTL